jgi:lipoprotein NlpI
MSRKFIAKADDSMLGGLLVFGAIVLGSMSVILVQSSNRNRQSAAQDWGARVEKAIAAGSTDALLKELDAAIAKDPSNYQLYLERGSLRFRTGKIEPSIEDFDRCIAIMPDSKPYLWQRGISLFYARKYDLGKEQFEIHRSVNPNDVENAFWHFLCAAKIKGAQEASQDILLSGFDSREPLMQIQKMIAGKMEPSEVVEAMNGGGKSVLFYGNLYLGLFFDAKNDPAKAKEHLTKCVEVKYPGYMYDVAKIHLKMLEEPNPTESKLSTR